MVTLTQKEAKNRLYNKFGNEYDYSLFEYKDTKTESIIICHVHGKFSMNYEQHMFKNSGCLSCSNERKRIKYENQFIEKSKKLFNNKYDYSLIAYKAAHLKVKIICDVHGPFEQEPNSHLKGSGCDKCGGSATLSTNDFIKKAKMIHGNKFDYSKSIYTGNKNKIEIICKEHGSFKQIAGEHLRGCECKYCSLVSCGVYSFNFFKKFPENKNKKAIFYLVKLTSLTDEFYKIGITINSTKKRFSGDLKNYKLEDINIKHMNLFDAFCLEQKIISDIKKTYKQPENTNLLGGETECFYCDNIIQIKKLII